MRGSGRDINLHLVNAFGSIENPVDSTNPILKIRVSVFQPRRAAPTDARSAPVGRAERVHSAPGHHPNENRTRWVRFRLGAIARRTHHRGSMDSRHPWRSLCGHAARVQICFLQTCPPLATIFSAG